MKHPLQSFRSEIRTKTYMLVIRKLPLVDYPTSAINLMNKRTNLHPNKQNKKSSTERRKIVDHGIKT